MNKWNSIKVQHTRKVIYAFLLLLCLYSLSKIVYADEDTIYKPVIQKPVSKLNNPFKHLKYEDQTFELAYKTFIYNNNATDAFYLALIAINKKPNAIIWRERLAQTAIWSGHVDVALEQMIYLIIKKKQDQYLPQAIKIATDTNRLDVLIPLFEYQNKREPSNITIISHLALAYDQIGEPNRAINFLQKNYQMYPHANLLQQIAHIYEELGDDQEQLRLITQISNQYGLSLPNVLDAAEIEYSHTKLQAAMNWLKRLKAPKLIADPKYIDTKAKLAWIIGDDKSGHEAYLHLYKTHTIDSEGIERLLLLQPKDQMRQTLEIAVTAWKKFQNVQAFLIATDIAIQLRNWSVLYNLYSSPINKIARQQLDKNSQFWYAQSLLLQKAGEYGASRELMLNAASTHPNNNDIRLSALNFIVDQVSLFFPEHDPKLLMNLLIYWQDKVQLSDEWEDIYVRALVLLNQPILALRIVQLDTHRSHTIAWYNSYAQLLETFDYNKSARFIYVANWRTANQHLSDYDKDDHDFWSTYNELAVIFAPVSISYPLSSYLAAAQLSPDAADPLTAWAIEHNNYELAAYMAAYFYPDAPPASTALRLAVMRNDRSTILILLTNMPEILPRKESVDAAQQINAIPLSQQIAHDAMVDLPNSENYKLMQDAFLQSASYIKANAEYEQFGPLQGPRGRFGLNYFYSNTWRYNLYGSIWEPWSNNTGDIATYPYIEKILGLMIVYQQNGSHLNLDIAEHHFLYYFYSAELSGDQRLTSKLSVSGKLGYNQRSTLDTFMLVAGVQDELIGNLNYDWTARDTVVGSIELDSYRLQDRTTLGRGTLFSGEYNHKIWLDYPDYTLQLNGSINRFSHTHSLIQGRALIIIPNDVQVSAENFLTQNYWQVGFNFIFGDELREGYTHAWRPYANLGVLYASTSGYGTDVDAGIAGSVIGRDKLSIYYTRSSSTQGQSQVNFMIGLQYLMYI